MASQEDYLDNLLKSLTHNEENPPVVENVQPKEEQEPEISVPEQEAEPEISVPEYEAEPEITMPEYEAEPEISVPEYEAEPEISEPEYEAEPEVSIPEYEAEPEVSIPEYEAEPEVSMPEYEAEPEISEPEYEAEPEVSIPEYEAEPEVSIPEYEAELEVSMPEYEPEPEMSVQDFGLESISEEEIGPQEEFLYAEENGMADITESETINVEESEIPGMEESEIPDMEESEIPDMEESEISGIEESEGLSIEENEIPNLEELIENMDENISDMEEKNVPENVPDLDAVMEMSEDEIAKLLSEGGFEAGTEAVDVPEQDVVDILDGAADDDLQDIQDMLQKSDNNEAVDDEIVELLQGVSGDEEDLEEKILSEDGSLTGNDSEELNALLEDPKKKKALEKKRQKEEKAAARKAAREEAKAQKAAKKRAKKAKKKRKNKDVQDIPIENINGEELLFDRDELDKLVSKAGQVGNEESEIEDDEDEQGSSLGLDLNSLLSGYEDSGEAGFEDLAETDTDEQSASDYPKADDEKKKEKKEKATKKEKAEKTGFLAKILSFLMDEDDEEDEEKENLRLSEENQGILNDLDKEGKAVKGGKGGTGGKKKKENKKEKPKKEEKPKKAPKPKKEKPPKEPEPYVSPRKRLTLKKVFPVVLLGITVLAAILIFVNICTDYVDKHAAKTAYYNGDYATCYQNLVGKELNETEAVMYGKSESILYIRLWYREYEMFVEEGSEVEALDSLIQTVKDYPMLYAYASKWNAEGDVYSVYADILDILLNKYGITELQAKEIAKERDDIEYTRMVVALAEGRPYGSWNNTGASGQPGTDGSLPHELPEESDLGQGNFVDNR